MKLDGGLSWRRSGPQRIIDGRFHRGAAQLGKVRARRLWKNRRGVQLGRITEHQSGAAQRVVVAMRIGLVTGGGVMGVSRHLVVSDGWRVRPAMRVFMTGGFNRLGADLHGPARDEDHRGQDLGQGGGEPLNHGCNIALPDPQENHLRPDVALACGYPLAKRARLRYAQP
jgi:hypothetical protein